MLYAAYFNLGLLSGRVECLTKEGCRLRLVSAYRALHQYRLQLIVARVRYRSIKINHVVIADGLN